MRRHFLRIELILVLIVKLWNARNKGQENILADAFTLRLAF